MNDTNNEATKCLEDNAATDRSNHALDAETLNDVQETYLFGEEATILAEVQLCADLGDTHCFWNQFGNDLIEWARAQLQ